ncbi:uncharacterized protein LOC128248119 isoform X1 [Octopus bimaculoides]|uniref:uncharacterized protein LOC128248119 isoform X1 n=1 Tax=Octopus bimaculoides TaxID=37653 RepID=UPI0022E7B9C7|nr:uncharacterized protein LOC128248119 isoform X1 [Octopus bimaculoides]
MYKVVSQHPADRGIGPIPGYVVSPYPYPNGASVPASLHSYSLNEKRDDVASKDLNNDYGGKMSMVQPPLASLMMYNNDYSQPPPAHMGIPPVHIDPKTGKQSTTFFFINHKAMLYHSSYFSH